MITSIQVGKVELYCKLLNEDVNNDSRLNLITEMCLGHVMSENKCSSFSAVNVFN